jgi:hypothetical protein
MNDFDRWLTTEPDTDPDFCERGELNDMDEYEPCGKCQGCKSIVGQNWFDARDWQNLLGRN